LDKGRLSYRHDGSETPRDRLELVAYNSDLNFMFACALDIIVKGVNNHPPKKSPSASLSVNVVLGGRRILTPNILDYVDEDWDAERGALKYSTKGNPSGGAGGRNGVGNIYDLTKSPARPIFQWTQADIDDGKLVFKHEGMETQGFLHFWVTDGKFIVNGELNLFLNHVNHFHTLRSEQYSLGRRKVSCTVVPCSYHCHAAKVDWIGHIGYWVADIRDKRRD
jgi:hypothetical protein